ncbi:DUF5994 family protein [Nocardia sp. NPDC056000]|uniref:DUF5994 family protein n=1 Tax=Nocardia sp. NPDC056000 TaxID=3345674 RepID=UPI0035E2A398
MTSQATETTTGRPSHDQPLRLELEGGGVASDGSWWPHGRDLSAELPELLAMLTPRLGPIHRVIYNLDEWDTAPRKLAFGGRQVRLDGYRHLPARTLEILGVDIGARLALRVIASQADSELSGAQQRWESEGGGRATS